MHVYQRLQCNTKVCSYDWVNSINGIRYKDDATIMAWNLANEARCQNCDPSVMQKWIERMSCKFKLLAPNHLFGIGYEGFYGRASFPSLWDRIRNLGQKVGAWQGSGELGF